METKLTTPVEPCAQEILEVVPLIMRAIRTQMRHHRAPDLSVPQFRTLAYLNYYQGASLSDTAGFIGLTLPSMSKLIDGLVVRQLVAREISPLDRRRVTLTLTATGRAAFQSAREATQTYLAQRLAELPTEELALVRQSMQVLRPLFTPHQDTNATHTHN